MAEETVVDQLGHQRNSDGQSELATLVKLLQRQVEQSMEREKRLEDILMLSKQSEYLSNQARVGNLSNQRPLQVNVERPVLSATATLSDFLSWKEAWLDFAVCQHFDRQDGRTRTAALRQSVDDDLRQYMRQDIIQVGEDDDVEKILTALEQFIRRQRNPLLDRIEYYNLRQEDDETFDSFYTTLGELHNACAFGTDQLCANCSVVIGECDKCRTWIKNKSSEIMRDRLIVGTRDSETRHKLLSESQLSLEKAVQICRAEEAARSTQQSLTHNEDTRYKVHDGIRAMRRTSYQRRKQSTCGKSNPVETRPGSTTAPPVSECDQVYPLWLCCAHRKCLSGKGQVMFELRRKRTF